MAETKIFSTRKSENFVVYSDSKFLYQIGKICAESGKYKEEGILCLDDYISWITFFNPTEEQQKGKVFDMKTKAIYFIGVLFYKMNEFEEAEQYLNQVRMDLLEIKETEKYQKCQEMLGDMFQAKFDIFSDNLIHGYFYPEYETKKSYNDSLDF